MKKLTKKQKQLLSGYDFLKSYPLDEGIKIIKAITKTRFDASFDVAVRTGLDPKKTDQMLRGTASLPHGTGKNVKILALCTPDKQEEAKKAGADYVGLEDIIKKIEGGWTDFDVMVTSPSVMSKVGRLGKILGPRGLMPNPKTGTVTDDVGSAISEIKQGKINFKVDKYSIIHASIGKVSFDSIKIKENLLELLGVIMKMKPSSAKGIYIKGIDISSTMSKGVSLDKSVISA